MNNISWFKGSNKGYDHKKVFKLADNKTWWVWGQYGHKYMITCDVEAEPLTAKDAVVRYPDLVEISEAEAFELML